MRSTIVTNIGGKFRRDKLEGRDHLVVPCVMLKEGVINGSAGALFYPEEEIEKSTNHWNGMPIVVDHPKLDGEFISARSAEVFNTRKVGVILDTEFDGKLRTECWFDEERTKAVDKRVHNAIIKKKQMEVSTGLDLDNKEKEGDYNGTKYVGVVSNLKPDHLAILPDKIGACSIAMGAGLFANVSKEPESIQEVWTRSITNALVGLGVTITANELSFSETSRTLSDLLSSKYGEPGKYWQGWICDVYPDYIVFSHDSKTWKQTYSKKGDTITLTGDPVEVRRVISYAANQSQPPEEVSKMAFNKKAFVDKLISNGDAAETDREKLMAVDDNVLALWEVSNPPAPKIKTAVKETPKEEPVANAVPVKMTDEEWLASAPKRLQKIVNRAETKENAERDQLITKIVNHKTNKFKKEWLEKQDTDVLEGMAAMIPVANADEDEDDDSALMNGRNNFEGAAGTVTTNGKEDEDEDVLVPITAVNFADPRKKR